MDEFAAAEVVDIPVVVDVLHVDGDGVVVEEGVACNWMGWGVLRLGWVSLEREFFIFISLYSECSIS